MALTTSTAEVAQPEDDSQWDQRAGEHRNNGWFPTDPLRWGVQQAKSGDVDWIGWWARFTNLTPTLPANATITSAVVRMTAHGNQGGGLSTLLEFQAKDGLWDAIPRSVQQWRDISGGTSYHGDFRIDVRDTGGGTITTSDIGSGNNFEWQLRRSVDGRYERLGQSMEAEATNTLGDIRIIIGKVGAPTGNFRLEVSTVDGNGDPDSLLATSDLLDVSTVSTTTSFHTIVFSGLDQIPLTIGDKFFVEAIGDWTINGTDYVVLRFKIPLEVQGGYTLGNAKTFGTGAGFDDQNYPTDLQLIQIPSAHPGLFGTWLPPTFVGGVEYMSPNIFAFLQAYIDLPAYVEGDPIALQVFRLTQQATNFRDVKGFNHVDTPGVSNQISLEVQWEVITKPGELKVPTDVRLARSDVSVSRPPGPSKVRIH